MCQYLSTISANDDVFRGTVFDKFGNPALCTILCTKTRKLKRKKDNYLK